MEVTEDSPTVGLTAGKEEVGRKLEGREHRLEKKVGAETRKALKICIKTLNDVLVSYPPPLLCIRDAFVIIKQGSVNIRAALQKQWKGDCKMV